MTNNIVGKVVVITGASGGLGKAIARHLASLGAKVVLGARRTERLEKLVAEINLEKGQAVAVPTDVTKRQDVERLASTAVEQFDRLDVLVNNAGIMQLSSLDKLRVEEWDRMIDVNIKGVLYGIAAVLPVMNKQQSGHIINIASVAGLKVFGAGGTVYSATKFAVRALSEGLRAEAGANIRTTIISPGAIESELKEGSTDPEAQEMVREFYRANQIPADSVARAVAYAIEQPIEVDVNEIVLRPTAQEF
jgi:NADP-dependent 3-hydroxy acid dehydrogenase YdfG